jgi:hypothetical protein
MLIVRSSSDIDSIADSTIRLLLTLRLEQLVHFDDGQLILVEIGDNALAVEEVSGIPLLHDPFEDVPFGHPDYTPSFDYLASHSEEIGGVACYELHHDSGDDGIGTTVFIPADITIDTTLLAICERYSRPSDR